MATKKKVDVYSGPALTEANLLDYEKSDLVAERALIAKVKECNDAAKVAQDQVVKLQAEKKALDKKAPDFKKTSKDLDAKIKALQGAAKKTCKLSHLGCVPSHNATRIAMPENIPTELNKKYGTTIDFDKLSFFEGGAHTQAYIPWWPQINEKNEPKIIQMVDSSGKEGPRLARDGNKSGATVGVGVDLGQIGETQLFAQLDSSNTGKSALTPTELTALKEKIKPYLLKKSGEACKYLHDHPLDLSEKEVNLLNKNAHDNLLDHSISTYEKWVKKNAENVTAPKKFKDLTTEQQTSIFSNGYQHGTPENAMLKAVATGNRDLIPKIAREHDYLFKTMPEPVKKP